ncbi:MAG: ParB/RepB/Spo0J family partition protein [Candidatus Bathyarchaeota archaeon]
MNQTQTLEILEIPVDKIKPSPYQPRIKFNLEDLRGSIIKYGIRDPIKVRKVGDYYELIDGERRIRIATQEGMKSVPCLMMDYTDEEADALSWRFNTERQEYSLEERAKHFKIHQNEGLSGSAIGRIHGYGKLQVNRLLAIFRLPEKYQNYMWTGEFAVQKYEYLYGKGLINESVSVETEVIKIIDETAIERRLTQREFENVVDGYLSDSENRQIEEAKKAVTKLKAAKQRETKAKEALGEPEVKSPETPEEFEEAAEALRREAERRKTEEQKAEEKRQKLITQARKSLNATSKKIDSANKIMGVSDFHERFIELEKSLEQNPAEVREQLIALGKEVTEAKKQRKKEIKEEKRHKEQVEKVRKLLSSISFAECDELGIDIEAYKNKIAEIESYLDEKPTEAWNAAEVLKKRLEEGVQEERIQKEAEKRGKELAEAEKRRIEEEARKKVQQEILENPEMFQEASEELRLEREREYSEMEKRAREAAGQMAEAFREALLQAEKDISKAKKSEGRKLLKNYIMTGSIISALEKGILFDIENKSDKQMLLWNSGTPLDETYTKLRKKLGIQ